MACSKISDGSLGAEVERVPEEVCCMGLDSVLARVDEGLSFKVAITLPSFEGYCGSATRSRSGRRSRRSRSR